MNDLDEIISTDGVGLIDMHVVRLFVAKYSNYQIINVEAVTYAGNYDNMYLITE